MKKKIFTMLALLCLTATGAWAQQETLLTTILNMSVNKNFTSGSKTFDNKVTVTFSDNVINDGTSWGWYSRAECTLTVTAAEGITISRVKFYNMSGSAFDEKAPFEAILVKDGEFITKVNGTSLGDGGVTKIEVYGIAPPEVTFNAAGTEASFDMSAYDLTVDYELVRDMSVDMTVSVEDAQGKSSIRLKKTDNGKYEPADMTPQQMAGLITVTDDIEQQELTNNTDYTVSIFAVDDNDQPTGTAIAFADLEPGRYVAFATAKEGTIYDGQTLPSNIFKLFVGYEVEVGAGEYATFYKDENLKLSEDTQNAELRTITEVSTDQAQATVGGDFAIAPHHTPLLVHNTADVKQTILLIPTEEQADEVEFAHEFKGTLDGITLPVATNTLTYYALNGTNFVWVKYQPLEVPANKCYLQIGTEPVDVKAITLVDEDDATGIESIDHEPLTNDDWYDLNGRKIQTPKQRGIYINNGKKVVVK